MSVAAADVEPPHAPGLNRAEGDTEIAFKRRGGTTVLDHLFQRGCLKARLPAVHGEGMTEAVLINTAGGLTDGDRLTQHIDWAEGTAARITSQAAERIYRSRGGPAFIDTRLRVDAGAIAHWLPQETILFDGGRLTRRNHVDMARGARLIATESVVAGRHAMDESVTSGGLFESWRIRYDGKLIFADGLKLDGDVAAQLDRPGIGGGARAFATLILAGEDAAAHLEPLRLRAGELQTATTRIACSALPSLVVVRILAADGAAMRTALMGLLRLVLAAERPGTAEEGAKELLPRVWLC